MQLCYMPKGKSVTNKGTYGYISVSNEDRSKAQRVFVDDLTKEAFKSEVLDEQMRYPKELGVIHPFSFHDVGEIYSTCGLVFGAVSRYVHSIIGEFTIKTKKPNATTILQQFIKDSNFRNVIRDWIIEGFVKGNGFLEIDLKEEKIRVISANDMYVVRDEKGEVLGYNQWVGGDMTKAFTISKALALNKVIPFKPEQIIHLKVNAMANSAYGYGIVFPNKRTIENILMNEKDLHQIVRRKAGMPIHVKVGQPGERVDIDAINAFRNDLQYLTNKTEWVTDANVEMKIIDFSGIEKSLTETLQHDLLMFSYGTQIPESLMGKGNISEGMAGENKDDWQNLIGAYQDLLESLLEARLFKKILLLNGFELDVDFVWNLPSESEINDRIMKLQTLLSTVGISENMKRYIELDIAKLLNFEGADKLLPAPSLDAEQEAADEAKLQQPETPGAKPLAGQKAHIHITESHDDMKVREFVSLTEAGGFNYIDYIASILQRVNSDSFQDIKAVTEDQIRMGLFPNEDVEKLREILYRGFQNNWTMRQISQEIQNSIRIKDRLDSDGNLIFAASMRPDNISRTETVRLANMGLIDLYKANGIEQVRFLAALSTRTCQICEDLNGQVFNINEMVIGDNQPPIHNMCRCTTTAVTD